MAVLTRVPPRVLAFGAQTALAAVALICAFLVRFDAVPSQIPWRTVIAALPVVLVIRAAMIGRFRLHRGIWWHVEVDDLLQVTRAVTLGTLLIAFVVLLARSLDVIHLSPMPVGVLILDWGANITLLFGARVTSLLARRTGEARRAASGTRRVLVVGAGEAGASFATQLIRSPRHRMFPVAFCDDDPRKVGSTIVRVPVAGTCDQIPSLVARFEVDLIVIALPTVTGPNRKRIIANCQEAGVPFRTLPSLNEILVTTVPADRIREVDVLDLLGRPIARVEPALLEAAVRGKRVLVTGAAGSVGGELARQIAHLGPADLTLIDRAETPLLFAGNDLARDVPELDLVVRIVDVTERGSMRRLLQQRPPDVVFHAAAHKHVPLMEDVPSEAVRNNVGGTVIVAEEAEAAGASCFVLISTDKAVGPSSVMGATKRLAELALREFARDSRMNVVAVRFGNVLGSSGSVVPIFKAQIAAGGPVRVTDARMERYFMALPEAAALILEAAAVGQRGQVLLLDMGAPVNILEMAESMITLSGFQPHEEIEIVFTGARRGEKLREELKYASERPVPTPYEKLLVLSAPSDETGFLRHARAFLSELPELDDSQAAARLWRLINLPPSAAARGARSTATRGLGVRPSAVEGDS